jgi:hypothetical protein
VAEVLDEAAELECEELLGLKIENLRGLVGLALDGRSLFV